MIILAMLSNPYAATEEMTNINTVSRLLFGPCTDQFRDLLRFHITPAKFPMVIQKNKFTPSERGPTKADYVKFWAVFR